MSNPSPIILLPEGEDDRVLQAALAVPAADARPAFIGGAGGGSGVLEIAVNPPDYADLLYQSYLPKIALSKEQIDALLADKVVLSALLLKAGVVDGVVAGAVSTTAHVVRTALKIVKLKEGTKTLSSFFLMTMPDTYQRPPFMMSDCGLVVEPSTEQLFDIAVSCWQNAQLFLQPPIVIALLSFSTLGSSDHAAAQKIKTVADRIGRERPDIKVIGEVQLDAAINPSIAQRKGLSLPQPANVWIFPDLNAGNIAYKLVQQLTGSTAVGPVLQGLQKPMNDLSRGATAEDIKKMILLTARQARC